MEFLRLTVALSLLVPSLLKVESKEDVLALAPNVFPAIYNFGDSNSDTGGMSAVSHPVPVPYGETYFQRPVGRQSDGRLIIDFIAEQLKLPYLRAYLDAIESNFRHGANFAVGGSAIIPQNNSISPFHLHLQVELYLQFKSRTTYLYEQESQRNRLPRPKDFSKALYMIDIGQNDLTGSFLRSMTDEQLQAVIQEMVNHIAIAVQRLYEEGGRTFWIHNTGPVGCLPVAIASLSDTEEPISLDEHGCIKRQNDIALKFNKKLEDRVVKLRKELPLAKIVYIDIYAAKYRLISKAKDLGFEDPLKMCCGKFSKDTSLMCGSVAMVNGTQIFAGSCPDPSRFISWDGVHYTEAANSMVFHQIVNGSLLTSPIPVTRAV